MDCCLGLNKTFEGVTLGCGKLKTINRLTKKIMDRSINNEKKHWLQLFKKQTTKKKTNATTLTFTLVYSVKNFSIFLYILKHLKTYSRRWGAPATQWLKER